MNFLERASDGQNQLWKYPVVCFGGFLGGQLLGSIPLVILSSMAFGISKNLFLFLVMFSFVVSLLITIYLIKILHRRTFSETVNGTRKIRTGRLISGALTWTIIITVYLIIDYNLNPENYVLQFNWGNFFILTVLALCLIPIQTTSEELLFRGYLAQGIAAWTKNRYLSILIPGLLFGLMHIANPEVAEFGFWLSMPQYIFFGLLFGLISVLDDGIELAMGMHAANNIFTLIFTTHAASALQTDAMFEVQTINPAKELVALLIAGLIVLTYFAFRYKWNFNIFLRPILRRMPD